MTDLQAQIDALEAQRLQRKGAVDMEREGIQKRFEEIQTEANDLQTRSNKLYADHLIEDAELRGEIRALTKQLEGK